MTNWKYIGWDDESGLPQVVVFPPTLRHSAMVPRHVVPKSAGFVEAKVDQREFANQAVYFKLSGHSDSLNLRPRSEDADAFEISP